MYYILGLFSGALGVAAGLFLIRTNVKPFVALSDNLLSSSLVFFDKLAAWLKANNLEKIILPLLGVLALSWAVFQMQSLFGFVAFLFGLPGGLAWGLVKLVILVLLFPVVAPVVGCVLSGMLARLPEHLAYRESLPRFASLAAEHDERPPVEVMRSVAAELSESSMQDRSISVWQQNYRRRTVERLKEEIFRKYGDVQERSKLNAEEVQGRTELLTMLGEYLKAKEVRDG